MRDRRRPLHGLGAPGPGDGDEVVDHEGHRIHALDRDRPPLGPAHHAVPLADGDAAEVAHRVFDDGVEREVGRRRAPQPDKARRAQHPARRGLSGQREGERILPAQTPERIGDLHRESGRKVGPPALREAGTRGADELTLGIGAQVVGLPAQREQHPILRNGRRDPALQLGTQIAHPSSLPPGAPHPRTAPRHGARGPITRRGSGRDRTQLGTAPVPTSRI